MTAPWSIGNGRRTSLRSVGHASQTLMLILCISMVSAAHSDELQALANSATHTTLWQSGWASAYTLGAVFYLHRADQHHDRDVRYDARINAAKAALALGDVLLSPPPHRREYTRVQQDGETSDDRIRAALAGLAEQEQLRASWQARVAPFIVNASAGLAIGAHDGRSADGLRNFVSGMLVTELRIRSEPRHATNHLSQHAGKPMHWHWWASGDQLGVLIQFR